MALNMSAQERIDAGENPLTAVPGGFAGSLANLAKRKITDPIKNWWDAPRPTAGDFADETARRYQPSGAEGDAVPVGLAAPVANLNWQQPVTPIDQPGLVAPTAAAGNLTWPSDAGRQTVNSGNIPLVTEKIKNGLQTVGARSRTPLRAPKAAVGTSPTVPDDAPWPQLPDMSPQLFTPVAGTDNIRTIDGRIGSNDIKGLAIPSGGGIATMGDQTALLRGGNSVPQAENDRVIAAREQQFAPQKTLVGSGLSAPRLVGPGEEAFAPDFSRMDTGQLMTNLLERKVANRDAKIAQEAQTAQSQVGLNAANVNHLNTESKVALGMVPYNQAHLTSTDNYQNAHAKVALGMLPINQSYATAHARLANSTAQANEYANSPEGRAEAQKQRQAELGAKVDQNTRMQVGELTLQEKELTAQEKDLRKQHAALTAEYKLATEGAMKTAEEWAADKETQRMKGGIQNHVDSISEVLAQKNALQLQKQGLLKMGGTAGLAAPVAGQVKRRATAPLAAFDSSR